MKHSHIDRTAHDHLRIVFNNQVVFLRLRDHATMGDVAQSLRDFRPRRYGKPIAINVTTGDSPELFRSSHFMPADFKYSHDPAAVDGTVSPGAIFTGPDHVAPLNA